MSVVNADDIQEDLKQAEKRLDAALDDPKRKKKAKKPKPTTLKKQAAEEEDSFPVVQELISPVEKAPEPDSEGWDSDLDVSEITSRKNTSDPYLKACEVLKISPKSFLLNHATCSKVVYPNCGIGPMGAQAFCQILELNRSIIEMDLSSNHIQYGGAHLFQSLALNTTLVTLNLADNQLGSSGIEIARFLSGNTSVTTLNLKGNLLGDQEACSIANGLTQNSTLKILNLSNNLIADIGAIALGNCLTANDTLTELDISYNTIRPRGMTAFLNKAKENTSIFNLNLHHNGMGEQGTPVQVYLARNQTITSLNLSYMRIQDAAFACIIKGVENNRSLVELNLSGNAITTPTFLALIKAIGGSKITSLIIKQLRLSAEAIDRVEELIRQKPELRIIA